MDTIILRCTSYSQGLGTHIRLQHFVALGKRESWPFLLVSSSDKQ